MARIKTQAPQPRASEVFTNPVMLAAFGFGTGLIRLMPGTWGSLIGVGFYFLLAPLGAIPYLVIVGVLFLAGIYLCGEASRRMGVHDHGGIVWDEIVGYLVTMLPICAVFTPHIFWPGVGFILFRAFDIFKPLGIRWLDRRVSGGFGIMIDDVAAGVCAGFCLGAIYWGIGVIL